MTQPRTSVFDTKDPISINLQMEASVCEKNTCDNLAVTCNDEFRTESALFMKLGSEMEHTEKKPLRAKAISTNKAVFWCESKICSLRISSICLGESFVLALHLFRRSFPRHRTRQECVEHQFSRSKLLLSLAQSLPELPYSSINVQGLLFNCCNLNLYVCI